MGNGRGGWAKSRMAVAQLFALSLGIVIVPFSADATAAECGESGGVCYVHQGPSNCDEGACKAGATCDGSAASPFCKIKDGLAAVVDGGIVRVNDGAYNEGSIGFPTKSITLESTNGPGSTSIVATLDYTKMTISNLGSLDPVPVVDGFTFTGGSGRAVSITNSDVTISNCVIRANGSTNLSYGDGGIYIYRGTITIEDSVFCQNEALLGGGIAIQSTLPQDTISVTRCIFENNFAELQGGAIDVGDGIPGTLIVAENLFCGNRAVADGGAISGKVHVTATAGDETPYACVVHPQVDHFMTIQNSIFVGNSVLLAEPWGSGAAVSGGVSQFVDIVNCTIVGNHAAKTSGAVYVAGSCTTIRNSVLWGNSAPTGKEIEVDYAGDLTLEYSDVQGGMSSILLTYGTSNVTNPTEFLNANNIDDDPLFCGVADFDFHLDPESPAIEVGNNAVTSGDVDYDGNTRTLDLDGDQEAVVDLGAYERANGTTCTEGGIDLQCACAYGTFDTEVPPAGTIDARRPHPSDDSSFDKREGIGSPNTYVDGPEPITITFDPELLTAYDVSCWSICETDIEEVESPTESLQANRVLSVVQVSPAVYEVLLERPISAGQWSELEYLGSGDSVSYASLPADAGGDETASAADVLDHLDCCVSGICTPPYGDYSCDIEHDGDWDSGDTMALIDLLNGAGTWIPWNNVSLPDNTCGGAAAAMSGGSLQTVIATSSFSERFVEFVQEFVPGDRLNAASFVAAATAVAEMSAVEMTASERAALASMLKQAAPFVRSRVAGELIPRLVKILTE